MPLFSATIDGIAHATAAPTKAEARARFKAKLGLKKLPAGVKVRRAERTKTMDEPITMLPGGPRVKQAYSVGGNRLAVAQIQDADSADDARMSAKFVITTEDSDRDGDVILTAGLDWAAHSKNPVVYYNHGIPHFGGLPTPIAVSESPDGQYTVEVMPRKAYGTAYFNPALRESVQFYDLVKHKFLRAASVTVIPSPGAVKRREGGGMLITAGEVPEWSIVGVGANRNAIRSKLLDGRIAGSEIGMELRKMLTPIADEATEKVVGGFEAPTAPPIMAGAEMIDVSESIQPAVVKVDTATVVEPPILDVASRSLPDGKPNPNHPDYVAPPVVAKGGGPSEKYIGMTKEFEKETDAEPVVKSHPNADSALLKCYGMHRKMLADCCEFMDEHQQGGLTKTQQAAVKMHRGGLMKMMDDMDSATQGIEPSAGEDIKSTMLIPKLPIVLAPAPLDPVALKHLGDSVDTLKRNLRQVAGV